MEKFNFIVTVPRFEARKEEGNTIEEAAETLVNKVSEESGIYAANINVEPHWNKENFEALLESGAWCSYVRRRTVPIVDIDLHGNVFFAAACGACGAGIAEAHNFCPDCGAKLVRKKADVEAGIFREQRGKNE